VFRLAASCGEYNPKRFNVKCKVTMKIIKFEDLRTIENPSPAQPYRMEVKLDGDGFKSLGGVFGLLVPGSQMPYDYHKDRESSLIPISGEAVESPSRNGV
jgi:hypothetical protein